MKKFLIGLLIMLLLTGGLVFYFLSQAHDKPLTQAEKEAAMQKLLGYRPVLSETPHSNAWITYKGKYFSLRYPGDSVIYHDLQVTLTPHSPENFQFESRTSPRYFFTIQITAESTVSSYDAISSVTFRRLGKGTYAEKPIQIDGHTGIVFIKNQDDGLEKTAFLIYQGKVYSFAITGKNPKTIAIFDKVMDSLVLY